MPPVGPRDQGGKPVHRFSLSLPRRRFCNQGHHSPTLKMHPTPSKGRARENAAKPQQALTVQPRVHTAGQSGPPGTPAGRRALLPAATNSRRAPSNCPAAPDCTALDVPTDTHSFTQLVVLPAATAPSKTAPARLLPIHLQVEACCRHHAPVRLKTEPMGQRHRRRPRFPEPAVFAALFATVSPSNQQHCIPAIPSSRADAAWMMLADVG